MISVLVTIILISLALVFNKSKAICILLFIFMFTLSGWNTWNGDYDAYERFYYSSILMNEEYEPGYILINVIFKKLGIEYQTFLQVIYGSVLFTFAYAAIRASFGNN